MKRSLDPIDERIIRALTSNARMSHAQIATLVNLSRNAVRQRIERLETTGAIGGYTLAPAARTGSPARLAAIIFVYRHDRLRGLEVVHAIRSIPEAVSCDVLSGDYDLAVRIEADDADRIRQVWEQIAAMPTVRDTVTSFILSSPLARTRVEPPSP